ncbi:hypothetical protein GCWU000324_00256 [Kingella oralis ATCC 51147]|jgi:hypothetical protein|uniref:Uncharacterized protein n=1 Tax=Kingella oralis ATCC 51147 TaxID=629741 RepID=C4GHC4_9NEIS|nr:hypothetical protein GCWU000324_00256 [Kingella oralis ATCC 51147]
MNGSLKNTTVWSPFCAPNGFLLDETFAKPATDGASAACRHHANP